jgi:bifunctional UDP-N-acetylglucosamine pyrophosphorylase/glucosamine-1-phosphate N-acetyltransferase
MVLYVLDAAAQENVRATVVVVGHGATWVEKALSAARVADVHLTFVEQLEQLGTGHAVSVALRPSTTRLGSTDGDVLILPGDTPLLRVSSVARLLERHRESQAALTVLTAVRRGPHGLRTRSCTRKTARVAAHRRRARRTRRASASDQRSQHFDHGRCARACSARRYAASDRQNAQARVLPDRPGRRAARGRSRHNAVILEDPVRGLGVNDRLQLAGAERCCARGSTIEWMQRGVTMWDPRHTYVDADVELAAEVSLLPGTF